MGLKNKLILLALCVALATADTNLFLKDHEYTYELDAYAKTQPDVGSRANSLAYKCDVTIKVPEEFEFELSLHKCELRSINAPGLDLTEFKISDKSANFDAELSKHPVLFGIDSQDNSVDHVRFHKDETLLARNIKRSVMSALLATDDLPSGWESKKDIFGTCEVKYTNDEEDTVWTTMERNLDTCHFPASKDSIGRDNFGVTLNGRRSTAITINATNLMSTFADSKSKCHYKITGEQLAFSKCTDNHQYLDDVIHLPGIGLTSEAQIELELTSRKTEGDIQKTPETDFVQSSIIFEHEEHVQSEIDANEAVQEKNLEWAKESLTALLSEGKASAKGIGSFDSLVQHLSAIHNVNKLENFITEAVKCDGCTEDQKNMVETHLGNALAECATEICIDGYMYQHLEHSIGSSKENAFRIWAYSNIDSEATILKLTQECLLDHEDNRYPCNLYVGAMIRKIYEKKRSQYGDNIPAELKEAVMAMFKAAKENAEPRIEMLVGIANMGEIVDHLDHINWLVSLLKKTGSSHSYARNKVINTAVVRAFRNFGTSGKVFNELLQIYKNDEFDMESRVLAYQTLFQKWPQTTTYEHLLRHVHDLPLKHPLRRYVISHINHYLLNEEHQGTETWIKVKDVVKSLFDMFETEVAFNPNPEKHSHHFLSSIEEYDWDNMDVFAKFARELKLDMDIDSIVDFGHRLPNSVFANVSYNPSGDRSVYLGQFWRYVNDLSADKILKDTRYPYVKMLRFFKAMFMPEYPDCQDSIWNVAGNDDILASVQKLKDQIAFNTEQCSTFLPVEFTLHYYKNNLVRSPDELFNNLAKYSFNRAPRVTGFYAIPTAVGLSQVITSYAHLAVSNTGKYNEEQKAQGFKPSLGLRVINTIRIKMPEYNEIGQDSTSELSTEFEIGFSSEGKIILPKEKLNLITFKHTNEYLSNDAMTSYLDNRETQTECAGETFEDVTGYKLCEVETDTDATDFFSYTMTAEKVDKKLEFIQLKAEREPSKAGFLFTAEAPGDKYKRKMNIELKHDKSDETLMTSSFKIDIPELPDVEIGYDFKLNKLNYDFHFQSKAQIIPGRFVALDFVKRGPNANGAYAAFNASTHVAHISAELATDWKDKSAELEVDCLLPKAIIEEEELHTIIPEEFWEEEDNTHLKVRLTGQIVDKHNVHGKIELPRHMTEWQYKGKDSDKEFEANVNLDMYKPKNPSDKTTVTFAAFYDKPKSHFYNAKLVGPHRSLEYRRGDESNTLAGDDKEKTVTRTVVYKTKDPNTKEENSYEFRLVDTESSVCKGCGVYEGVDESDVKAVSTTEFYFPLRGKEHSYKVVVYGVDMAFGGYIQEDVFNTKLTVAPISIMEILGGQIDVKVDVSHTKSGAITKNRVKGTFDFSGDSSEEDTVRLDVKLSSTSKSHDLQSAIKYYEDKGIEKYSQHTTLKSDIWKDIEFTSTSSSELYPLGDKMNWLNDDAKYKEGSTMTRTKWLEPKAKYLKRTTTFDHDVEYKLLPSMTWETNFKDFKDYSFRVTYPNSKEMVYLAANVSDNYMNMDLVADYTDETGTVHHFATGTLEPLLPYRLYLTVQRNESLTEDLMGWAAIKGIQLFAEVLEHVVHTIDPEHPVNKIWSPILGGKTVQEYFSQKIVELHEVRQNIRKAIVEPKESWQIAYHPFAKLMCNIFNIFKHEESDYLSELIEEAFEEIIKDFDNVNILEALDSFKELSKDGTSYLSQVIPTYKTFSNFGKLPHTIEEMPENYREPKRREAHIYFEPLSIYTFDDHPINFHLTHDGCPILLAHDLYASNYTLTATKSGLVFYSTPRPEEYRDTRVTTKVTIDMSKTPIVASATATDANGKESPIAIPYTDDYMNVASNDDSVTILTDDYFFVTCANAQKHCTVTTRVSNTNHTLGVFGNADGHPSDDLRVPSGRLVHGDETFVKAYLLDHSDKCKDVVELYDKTKCTNKQSECQAEDDYKQYYFQQDCRYKTKCGATEESVREAYEERWKDLIA